MRGLVAYRKNTPPPSVEASMKREYSPFASQPPSDAAATPKDAETTIAENKNTITRTVLTCMRLYGFNRPVTSKHVDDTAAPHADTDEDEFKATYVYENTGSRDIAITPWGSPFRVSIMRRASASVRGRELSSVFERPTASGVATSM